MTLREMLFNAIWRCGFAPHEDPAVVEKMKSEWPDDAARVEKLGDAALSALRQWLADQGLVVVPIHSTLQMDEAGSKEARMAHAEGISVDVEVVWDFMIAAAPDALREGE